VAVYYFPIGDAFDDFKNCTGTPMECYNQAVAAMGSQSPSTQSSWLESIVAHYQATQQLALAAAAAKQLAAAQAAAAAAQAAAAANRPKSDNTLVIAAVVLGGLYLITRK
jgi:hypothetical protein